MDNLICKLFGHKLKLISMWLAGSFAGKEFCCVRCRKFVREVKNLAISREQP
jgi:hypothetical protein